MRKQPKWKNEHGGVRILKTKILSKKKNMKQVRKQSCVANVPKARLFTRAKEEVDT